MTGPGLSLPPVKVAWPRYLRRITVILAVLAGVTWILAIFAVTQFGRVQEKFRDIQEQTLTTTQVLGQITHDLSAYRIAEARVIIGIGSESPLQTRADMVELEGRIRANIRVFQSLDNSDEEMRLFMKFLSDWYSYSRMVKENVAGMTHPGRSGIALMTATKPLFSSADITLNQLIRINVEEGRTTREDAEQIFRSSITLIFAMAGLATLLILAMLLRIVWHESR